MTAPEPTRPADEHTDAVARYGTTATDHTTSEGATA